jgi:hypothetical protein
VRVGNWQVSLPPSPFSLVALVYLALHHSLPNNGRKEIGVRKVLGATVFNVWRLLSKDFVMLVIISLLIAVPTAYYFMYNWLQNYEYRTELSWWIFAGAGNWSIKYNTINCKLPGNKAASDCEGFEDE